MEPATPARNFASAVCSIDDVFDVIVEQIRKFVSALNITKDFPHKPFSPIFSVKLRLN